MAGTTTRQQQNRRNRDDDDDGDEPRTRNGRPSPEVLAARQKLAIADEDAGLHRQDAPASDKRVVVLWKENVAPYKAGEIAAVPKAVATAAIGEDYAELWGDGRPQPRDKRSDWINNQPRHNATGGVASSGGAPAFSSDALNALAKQIANAAQVSGLQEQVHDLREELVKRDDVIASFEKRFAALEGKK